MQPCPLQHAHSNKHTHVQVEVLRNPSLEEFSAKVESFKPSFVYISGPYSGLVDSIKGTVGPITLQGELKQSGGHGSCCGGGGGRSRRQRRWCVGVAFCKWLHILQLIVLFETQLCRGMCVNGTSGCQLRPENPR